MGFFDLSGPNLYIAISLIVVNSIIMCFAGIKFFQVLQLGGYSTRAYFFWLKDTKAKWLSRILMLFLLSCASIVICNVLFGSFDANKLYGYIGLIFYFIFLITFIVNMLKVPQKTPLKITKRMLRLIIVYFILQAICCFFLLCLADFTEHVKYALITITVLLIPLLVVLANLILKPLENLIKYSYKQKAKKRLEQIKNLKVIGITGSYGKTSVKKFLYQILSSKYRVYASPSSYNTPMGLSKVILSELKDDTEIFIAEMGANRSGDIKEICDFVKPNMGVLTGIANQHINTFKTLENIKRTKFELVESLSSDDYCFFNINSDDMQNLYDRCKLRNKQAIVLNDVNQKYTALDIKATDEGSTFKLKLDGEIIDCKTRVLGEHNIENIVLASSICHNLKMTAKQIAKQITKLEPISHRLEVSKAQNGVTIIDDSFNANIIGSKLALKTLSYFEDKRKVIVTPGLVELGEFEEQANEDFGKEIAKVCDVVIIVNKINAKSIRSGLISEDFNMENVYFTETLSDATKLMGEVLIRGDVVLLENDLPDNYI